jgi:putative nucleotidyltransferase with HDIG domain
MISNPSGAETICQHFGELHTSLVNVVEDLSHSGGSVVPGAVQDIKQISQSLLALENRVSDQLNLKQSQLGALMHVGRAINSSLGLKRVLEEVMDSLVALMRAERGFLMLRDPNTGELSVRTARGLDHVDLDEEEFKVSKTVIQRVAESGEPVLTTNAQEDPRFDSRLSIMAYHLRSILCVPLKIKNALIGVVYVDNRERIGIFRDADLGLISAFADQAAVAIDGAQLFEKLQQSHRELENAYEATLAGWAKALELRDKETEGHTQRVTMLTERLARAMGVDDAAIVHIKRGALLHDIGKMGIPDNILLKNGPLTEEERLIVEKHPLHAYEMLSSIEFLLPALDIPYCHHEKWDGTGYPRGLKGEEIPFAARLFPVVDVWDALVSDRPYRNGLPPDEVRQRIKDEAGKHFDPRVVEAFMDLKDLSV